MNNEVVSKLQESVFLLEISVNSARQTLTEKYGIDHPVGVRLDSYIPAIENQKAQISKLQNAIQEQNFGEVVRLATIINGISFMIKDDARQIVEYIHSGISPSEIDKDLLN